MRSLLPLVVVLCACEGLIIARGGPAPGGLVVTWAEVASKAVPENAGAALAFTAQLSAPSTEPVTVAYTVAGTAGTDDHTLRDGVLTFAPGETTASLGFEAIDDATIEFYETVKVTMESAVNAGLAPEEQRSATMTLLNDDTVPAPPFAAVLPILQARCIGCHDGSKAPTFAYSTEREFTSNGLFQNGGDSRVLKRTFGSWFADPVARALTTMPMGSTWTPQEFETVKAWVSRLEAPPGGYDPGFSCESQSAPAPAPLHRLAKVHYVRALEGFLGKLSPANRTSLLALLKPKIDQLPTDSSAWFSRNDDRLFGNHVDTLFEIAFSLATALAADPVELDELVRVSPSCTSRASLADPACVRDFIGHYGLEAFRRPLTAAEAQELEDFYGSNGADGVVAVLTRLVAHPRFYYALDIEGTKLSGTEGVDATYQLTDYELLSRLTFLYWGAPPDDGLYALLQGPTPLALSARTGVTQAEADANLNTLVERIATDPKARGGIREFYDEWLELQRTPSPGASPAPAYATFAAGENIGAPGHHHREDMIDEVLDLADHYTFTTAGRYDDLLLSPYSFARSADLAHLYGLGPWDGSASSLQTFPTDQPRQGLLTRAAFLVSSHEYTSPILKGRKVRVNLLCDRLPPPPPGVNVVPLSKDPARTTRQVVEHATASGTCQGCHKSMNPIGFTSEGYDALGRYRKNEARYDEAGAKVSSLPVDTAVPTALVFDADAQGLPDSVALAHRIIDSGKGQQCMVRQFFRFAYGRDEVVSRDGCDLEELRLKLTGGGGSIRQMLQALALRPSFRQRAVGP